MICPRSPLPRKYPHRERPDSGSWTRPRPPRSKRTSLRAPGYYVTPSIAGRFGSGDTRCCDPLDSLRFQRHAERSQERQLRTRRRRRQPALEALEGRALLSTLTVLNNADSGSGSLRAEIAASRGGDTIVFSHKLDGQTITLTSGELIVNKDLNIDGPGAQRLAVSGGGASRVFDISGGATVTLSGLTITGGSADMGGGILNEAGATLDIIQATLTDNQALGGASGNADGGAIENEAGASLSIVQTALVGNQTNSSNQSYGGAIYNQGNATIRSSTFTANQALGSQTSFGALGGSVGGAIMNVDGATLIVKQSGFASNQALGGSGGDALGGAIDNESASASLGVTTSIINSTFSGNQAIAGANVGNGNQGGFGGALEDLPGTTITVIGSAFANNQAVALSPTSSFASSYANGGAIDNGADTFSSLNVNLTVDSSLFAGNLASGGQGLAPGFANFAYGGAVTWNLFGALGGSVSVSGSSFVGNQAIGGPATDGDEGAGVGGPASGGAIFAGSAAHDHRLGADR